MKAYASVSGGVIFVPEKLSVKTKKKKKSISYKDILGNQIDEKIKARQKTKTPKFFPKPAAQKTASRASA